MLDKMTAPDTLSAYAQNIVGHDKIIPTPYGELPLTYADWAAEGREYEPINRQILKEFAPLIANTHTETNATGRAMTEAYARAKGIIKQHVGANDDYALIMTGWGMTDAAVRFQRLLGWRGPERWTPPFSKAEQPLVIVSGLEHHSNHTTWLATGAEVVVAPNADGKPVDLAWLEGFLADNKHRQTKVAAVTAGSNVTGVRPPIHAIAEIMHEAGGRCFVDYTCAAPYDNINVHPSDEAMLDAIYFSPHKFLGGPGSPGVLIFNKELYDNRVPDRPGGGTVAWTNPWGGRRYHDDIETREDGGTPPFLGTIRAALAIVLKETMGLDNIAKREREISAKVFSDLAGVAGVSILAPEYQDRLPVFSFTTQGLHYNLVAALLNDRFGVQVRGGCACAGTYGHQLFGIDREQSRAITDEIDRGNLSGKPGFTRASFHPTMSDATIEVVTDGIKTVAQDGHLMARDYEYNPATNEFTHRNGNPTVIDLATAFRL